MSERKVTDSPQGWRALDRLREERSAAIENLSCSRPMSKSKSNDRTCSETSSDRSPTIPVVLVNSLEVDSLGGNTILDGINEPGNSELGLLEDLPSSETELDVVFDDVEKTNSDISQTEKAAKQNACDLEDSKRGSQRRGSTPSLLGVPEAKSPHRRRTLSTTIPVDGNRSLCGVQRTRSPSPGVTPFINRLANDRSRSPSLSRRNSKEGLGPTRSGSQYSFSAAKASPLSSPDVSPLLPRRRTSLTLPGPETLCIGKSCQRPPSNTEERLRTRSSHYKLQQFLDQTKSQLTTAQTLEFNAEAAANTVGKI